MTKIGEMYKCEICGNLVSVIEEGKGTLVCCGQDMVRLSEKTGTQVGSEKHVPVVEIREKKVIVRVGSVEHPMDKGHYIELIQLMKNGKVIFEKRLYPQEKPYAEIYVESTDGLKARALCNVHGLWKN